MELRGPRAGPHWDPSLRKRRLLPGHQYVEHVTRHVGSHVRSRVTLLIIIRVGEGYLIAISTGCNAGRCTAWRFRAPATMNGEGLAGAGSADPFSFTQTWPRNRSTSNHTAAAAMRGERSRGRAWALAFLGSRLLLGLRSLLPVRHTHLPIHRRRNGEVLVRLLTLAHALVEPAEAEVAVGDEWAHAELVGK